MTTLVTGARGLVGSRVVARLLRAGEEVVGVGRAQVDLAAGGHHLLARPLQARHHPAADEALRARDQRRHRPP